MTGVCVEDRCEAPAFSLSAWCTEHSPLRWTVAPGSDGLPPTSVGYYQSGAVRLEEWEDSRGVTHRLDGPAIVLYTEDGSLRYVSWRMNGQTCRTAEPNDVILRVNGGGWSELYRLEGKKHRLEGPAELVFGIDGAVRVADFYVGGEKLSAATVANYREAIGSGAPHEWALAYALGATG